MDNVNNPYNQQPQIPQLPTRVGIRAVVRKVTSIFPKWLSSYPISVYLGALAIVSFMYTSYSMPWYYSVSGIIAISIFFLYGSTVAKDTAIDKIRKEKAFEKRIFLIAFIPRLLFMILMYWIFQFNYGDAFGFESADAFSYHELGTTFGNAMRNGNFAYEWQRHIAVIDLSDLGYATYVGFIYWLTGDSIIILRLIKCILSAISVVLIYRLAKRNFGEQTGRIAAIFVALWPNFWYYSSCHLKETEMVFLAVLFVEQADQMLRSRQFTAWKVIPVLLIAAAMFTFRTPLGLVALLSLLFSVVMSSTRVVSWGKRIVVGSLAIALIGVTMGNRIQEQGQSLLQQARGGQQRENMEWRAERKGGNVFAKYAGATVFAPMIFTLPFPSMVNIEGQDQQQLLNGGNFVKNIMSAFTILALVMLLMSGDWRKHMLPLSFMLGYLVVLAFSSFAQSERFHQPAMPFELMFAAYGLSIAVTKKKYKRWFTYWSALMFVAAITWNWFKLKGRGL